MGTSSIRFRLLMMILLTVLLLWAGVLLTTWWRTSRNINDVYDTELRQIARLLTVATEHEAKESDLKDYADDLVQVARLLAVATAREAEEQSGDELHDVAGYYPLIFQIWNNEGHMLVRGPGAPAHPISSAGSDGFSNTTINDVGWRVYIMTLPDKSFRIQVARSQISMYNMVSNFVADVIKPLLLVLPLFGMLWWVVHRGLEPLRQISRLIAERDYSHLNPVMVEGIPEESSRLVDEINALLMRLRTSIDRNSRFTADVAHELRTPIAGMLVQLQSDDAGLEEEARSQIITRVRRGLEHLGHVINQLLVLASIEPNRVRQTFQQVDLAAIARERMADLAPLAMENGIEIELKADAACNAFGNRELLGVLISNLINNAIKFSGNDGYVLVTITDVTNGISLTVADTGPGIPEEKKAWVFERLNKGSRSGGSGLGLSIVKEICQIHQASISLHDRKEGTGLIVNLFLPKLSKR
jgi:two-component system, OmpR family, sensor histidine kinase QseC